MTSPYQFLLHISIVNSASNRPLAVVTTKMPQQKSDNLTLIISSVYIPFLCTAQIHRPADGAGELHPAAAGRRAARLPAHQRRCSSRARGLEHHGHHRQQTRQPHHPRGAQDLRRRLRVHPADDQQGL
jgi:hypothetical protein